MRVFVAIELPGHVRAKIFHTFENLKNSGLISGNFVEKNNLHLTLQFIGEISEEKIKELEEKLSEINFNKFEASTGKIGIFPNEDYVKVIWIGLEGKEIFELQKIIEDKLGPAGFNVDEKEFIEHVTLVRVKNIKNKDLFKKKLSELRIHKEKFEVNKFSLIKSELQKEGPVYKTIKEFDLK